MATGVDTKEALLDAARGAFAQRGFQGASVREIAGRAGVNIALVSYHFGSKEGLYLEALSQAMGRVRERLVGAASAPGPLAERAAGAVSAYLDHLRDDRELPRLIVRALLDGDAPAIDVVARELRAAQGALLAALAPPAADAPRAAVADPARLAQAAMTLFGAAVAPFLYAPIVREVLGAEPTAPEAIEARRAHLVALARDLFGDV